MKRGILGSAPSLPLAPFGDPSWTFFGCSPGVYPYVNMSTLRGWFELHRWEPGEIGKPATQKPWFSPEYVAWMRQLPAHVNLWMQDTPADMANSKRLPIEELSAKYGTYFWTSSISIMLACAIEDILEERNKRDELFKANPPTDAEGQAIRDAYAPPQDEIGLWGVDMTASEEYGYQRAGCQHFLTLATTLGIKVTVPPESDLLRPMPIYGFCEGEWWHIKLTSRQRELQNRLNMSRQDVANATRNVAFLEGALDDLNYQLLTWGGDRDGAATDPRIYAQSPGIVAEVLALHTPPKAQPILLGELGDQGQVPGAVRIDERRKEVAKKPAKKARKR